MTTTPLPQLPEDGPAAAADVAVYLGLGAVTDGEQARLDRIVAAVNLFVRGLPKADASRGSSSWPADVVEGATMLAGRLWRRKESTAGVAAVNDFGPLYVQRNDPDVALLLGLGEHGKPSVC